MKWFVLASVVVGAGCSAPVKRPPPRPPSPPNTIDATAGSGDCTCARLEAPLQLPDSPAERARWQAAAAELEALHAALAALVPRGRCDGATIEADLQRTFAAHAHALDEDRALDTATCDHFSRWLFNDAHAQLVHDAGVMTTALRGGCAGASDASTKQLQELLVTRGCTTTR